MQEKVVQGFRLSPQQRHLWSLERDDGGRAYRARCEVQIEGALDPEALKAALRDVVERQEILRTTFQRFVGMTVPVQVISEESVSPFRHEQLQGFDPEAQEAMIAARVQEANESPLNLELGPLVYTSLFTLAPSRHVLHISLPALCADALGLYNLVREIARSYAACLTGEELTDESVQYADLSEWQNELLEAEDTETGREFWRNKDFSDVSAFKLPWESSSPAAAGFAPQRLSLPLDAGLVARVEALCRKFETSLPTLFAACWQVLLWRLTRQTDFTLGIALDGRKHEELKEPVGLFAKFLPYQSHLEQNQTYAEHVARVGEATREMNNWQEFFSQQRLAPAADGDSAAFFFPYCFQSEPPPATYTGAGVSFTIIDQHACIDRFKIKLSYAQSGGAPSTDFHYDSNLFSHADIVRLAHHYHNLLASVVEHPAGRLGDFEILSEAERQQILVDFNPRPSPFPESLCLHQLIENQVGKTPGAVAAVFGGGQLSYRELNRRANQLAHYLRQRGVGPEVRVAVCMERSLDMIVALLGILKAGGAYVPLHPAYPKDSLAFQLHDCRAVVLLTTSGLLGQMPESPAQAICLDSDAEAIARQSEQEPVSGVVPGNMALLQYTSGSMGKPKGIELEHRSLVNYLTWVNETLFDETTRNLPSVSRLTVDASLKQLFAPLLQGGRVWIIPSDVVLQPAALLEELSTAANVGLNCVPSLWRAVLETIESGQFTAAALKNLTSLLIGGEELTAELVQRSLAALPHLRIWNLYGPAEATANTTAGRVDSPESLTIGRAIANTQVFILDPLLHPLPVGSPGELFVGGAPLARGYSHRPDLTALSFIPNPFAPLSAPGSRLYRTGDLARFRPDGQLEFLGRADHQLKIRGFRIEPGEVESALLRHPQVRHAVVTAREDTPGMKRLVAHLVFHPQEPGTPAPPTTAELRAFLGPLLPEQMVPSAFVRLAALPLLPNGKVNRRALPAPELASGDERTTPRREAGTPAEKTLCEIWQQVLGVAEVGVDDNFFELGGDSILSIQIIARANRAGLRLTPRQLFEHQTVAGLAAVADTTRVVVAEQGAVEGGARLTP
ncbi:MAG: amino acid adenylation domain-containing protein, partial [Pyrinomonadaceae bacterium]